MKKVTPSHIKQDAMRDVRELDYAGMVVIDRRELGYIIANAVQRGFNAGVESVRGKAKPKTKSSRPAPVVPDEDYDD